MAVISDFNAAMQDGPGWVLAWVNFMGVILMMAVPFSFVRIEARWALLVIALTMPTMLFLFAQLGYVRLLGAVHVVFWSPFVIYLWRRRNSWRVKETLSGKWIVVLFITMIASLAFDYADVIRYALGERDPVTTAA